jgi:hypothetical protein
MSSKVNNRTIVYQGKVFELIRENITLENGTTAASFCSNNTAMP